MLDIALMIGLVVAYQPTWTGISLHQWLSISIIVPLLLHVIVNWEWAIRILRTFIERLLHTSRLNLVIDCGLLLSTVAVMVSGFMVSPALLSPLGIHPSDPLVWHILHLWTANATIGLLAVHGVLHWRWVVATATRLIAPPSPVRWRRIGTPAAAARAARTVQASDAPAPRRSKIGVRAKEAAAERAAALRTASVLAVVGALSVAVFASAGALMPILASASQSPAHGALAKANSTVCPKTGCTASTCHATYGKSADVFYRKVKKSHKATSVAEASNTTVRTPRATASKSTRSARHPVAKPAATRRTAPARAPKRRAVATKTVKKPTVRRVRMRCPATGCSASSCHGTHHQSAASYYK